MCDIAGMRRVVVIVAVTVVAALALVAVGPVLFQPTGHRLAMTERPSDYGLPDEVVTFHPDDRPIALRAWWIPAEAAPATLVFIHGGGDDNRNLPYG